MFPLKYVNLAWIQITETSLLSFRLGRKQGSNRLKLIVLNLFLFLYMAAEKGEILSIYSKFQNHFLNV